jgi:hypothetical protein
VRRRLGELLVEAELLDEAQVTEALRLQVMWGGRLGTVLGQLGYVDLDTLSRALGSQHSLPAALAKHFDHADRALQRDFSADLADFHGCVPLLRAGKRVVIASIDPLNETASARVARGLGVTPDLLIHSIAAELRIRYQLERIYAISRPHRLLRAPGQERTAPPRRPSDRLPAIPLQDELEALFPSEVAETPERPAGERRTYVPTLGEPSLPRAESGVVERPGDMSPRTLDTYAGALHAIRCAIDRADIAALTVDAIASFVPAAGAAVLVVRGSIATTWTSFRSGRPPLTPISIRLDRSELATAALTSGVLARASTSALGDRDRELLDALGSGREDLVVAPILVEDRVAALIAIALPQGTDVEASIREIAGAAGAAFDRLVRDVSQATRTRILSGADSAPFPKVD